MAKYFEIPIKEKHNEVKWKSYKLNNSFKNDDFYNGVIFTGGVVTNKKKLVNPNIYTNSRKSDYLESQTKKALSLYEKSRNNEISSYERRQEIQKIRDNIKREFSK